MYIKSIITQNMMMKQSEPPMEYVKKHQHKLKVTYLKLKLERIDASTV